MIKLSSMGRACLKGCHIVCTCAWIGAGVCMFLLNFVARPNNGHDMYVVMAALKLIDDLVIIPAAAGSLITGLLICWLTPWGFFKWRWIVVKWSLTIAMSVFGMLYLSPWLHEMADIATADPNGVLQNQTFIFDREMLSISGAPMFLAMFFLVFVSMIKPWSGRSKARSAARSAARPAASPQVPLVTDAPALRVSSLNQVDEPAPVLYHRQRGIDKPQIASEITSRWIDRS
jgi:hypothetical protein